MDLKQLIAYCELQSRKKWETAEALFKAKRYADCLFFCHLAIEFSLKAKVVERTQKAFPMTHDVSDLALKSGLAFSKIQRSALAVINTFNIAGRYDDYKLSFYKKADRKFTKKYFDHTKTLLLWLENQSIKKK